MHVPVSSRKRPRSRSSIFWPITLEEVFNDLASLPPDEQAELAALNNLSADTLWTIAAERMPPVQQERLSLLLALNKRGSPGPGIGAG